MIPVEGHKNLFRDPNTNAIINKDNLAYENSLSFWGNKGTIIVPNAFSKNITKPSSIVITNEKGVSKKVRFEPHDYFVEMIDYFCFIVRKNRLNKKYIQELKATSSLLSKISEEK